MGNYKLLEYELEIIDIKDFKNYFKNNLNNFDGFAKKSFLKAIDIPPTYFLEQPEETKDILLTNKEDRINSLEKYIGKCIVILWKDNVILNTCRMSLEDAESALERLSTIEDVENIIWDKTFYKDGYIQGYISVGKVQKEGFNKCLLLDFPIILCKPPILHEAFFMIPTESNNKERDIVYYNSSIEVNFNEYQHIALAVDDELNNMLEDVELVSMEDREDNFILREVGEIICELAEDKIVPKTLISSITGYIETNLEGLQLSINKLSKIILDYEGNMKNIKQLTNLRMCYNWLYDKYNTKLQLEEV